MASTPLQLNSGRSVPPALQYKSQTILSSSSVYPSKSDKYQNTASRSSTNLSVTTVQPTLHVLPQYLQQSQLMKSQNIQQQLAAQDFLNPYSRHDFQHKEFLLAIEQCNQNISVFILFLLLFILCYSNKDFKMLEKSPQLETSSIYPMNYPGGFHPNYPILDSRYQGFGFSKPSPSQPVLASMASSLPKNPYKPIPIRPKPVEV